ncbi:MAG TPA: threonine--tRNA ligase [Candidatus Dormibacteraeota bacterium]|nr:threonine--tRNA ligase [Candidatus Dormibacteraeota bacterium]
MPDEVVDDASEAGLPLEAPSELTLDILRHSAAHLMAAAVTELFPGAQYDVGPPIEDGFFYNFKLPDGRHFTDADLAVIEQRMHELAGRSIPYQREVMDRSEARSLFDQAGQQFKVAIIDNLADDVSSVGVYRTGEFVDLCRGPHVPDSGDLRAVKLLRVAGVYWRGDERNEQLQRVYGTAWFTQEDLDQYLHRLEEAERRDHRRIGRELELFHFDPTAPGMTYWLPNGVTVFNELLDYSRAEHKRRGYQEISTPVVNEKHLWEISGHWDHFRDNMFVIPVDEQTTYGTKPMNCPNAHVVYNLRRRSYRELPLRFADWGVLHRFERSGTLHGLLRVRKFQQDDAHIFITEEQIEEEYGRVFDIVEHFYGLFDLEYSYRLGTRPDHFLGDAATWDRAEAALLRILESRAGAGAYAVDEGEGAFYGPKIDVMMRDAIGRTWQLGTIQLDFQLPRRFGCVYIDSEGHERTPAVIHRAIYGSLERFIGVLIEHVAGHLPLWLAPVQCELAPVQDDDDSVMAYVDTLAARLRAKGLRVEVSRTSGQLNAKVRDAELRRVPYVVVLGRKDVERGDDVVRVRDVRKQSQRDVAVQTLVDELAAEVSERRPA